MFYPLKGQTIHSDGAQLRIADGVLNTALAPNGGAVFMIVEKTHVTIEGVKLDMNGAGNRTPAGGYHPAPAFLQEGGSYSALLDNEVVDSPGRNAFKILGAARGHAADHCTLRGNTVRNGGTNLASNVHQDDWSAFYVECSDAIVEENQVQMDRHASTATPNNGGIELHASSMRARGNHLEKVYPAFYVGSNLAGRDITDVTIENNVVSEAQEGVSFFPVSSSDNYGRIRIAGNEFSLSQHPGVSAHPRAISMQRNSHAIFSTGPGLLYASEIANNRMSSQTARVDSSSGIVLSQSRDVVIQGNVMTGLGSACIILEGAPLGHTNTKIIGRNTCTDFGTTPSKHTHAAIIADTINDRPPEWHQSTPYALHQWVRPTSNNGFTYELIRAGMSGTREPVWPRDLGTQINDGSAVWACRPPWSFSELTVENNVIAQSTARPDDVAVYVTRDSDAAASVRVSDVRIRENVTRNVGKGLLDKVAPRLEPK
jgi:hypothetical protein